MARGDRFETMTKLDFCFYSRLVECSDSKVDGGGA